MPAIFPPFSIPKLADIAKDGTPGTKSAMKELEEFLYSLLYSLNQGQSAIEEDIADVSSDVVADGDDFLEWVGL